MYSQFRLCVSVSLKQRRRRVSSSLSTVPSSYGTQNDSCSGSVKMATVASEARRRLALSPVAATAAASPASSSSGTSPQQLPQPPQDRLSQAMVHAVHCQGTCDAKLRRMCTGARQVHEAWEAGPGILQRLVRCHLTAHNLDTRSDTAVAWLIHVLSWLLVLWLRRYSLKMATSILPWWPFGAMSAPAPATTAASAAASPGRQEAQQLQAAAAARGCH